MTQRQRKVRRRRRRHTGRSSVLLGLAVLATVAVIGVLSAVGYVLAIAASAPDLSELKPADKGQLSVVYAADGSRLGFIQSDILRRVVPWRDIPVNLRRATVAIEDERFYKHGGVDLNAIVRAGIKNLESGKTVQGGSTITQQLVRALYIKDPKRDFARKIREAKLASELEEKHSKTWVLRNYLNSVPYGTVGGRTAIGVEAASVTFFNKHASRLRLFQAALLAGLPQAPSEYNPFRNPQAALERRNEVLRQMRDNGYIDAGRVRAGVAQGSGPPPRHPLHPTPRALLLRLRPGEADRALRRGGRAPRWAAHPHHDRPDASGRGARGDQRLLRRSQRAQLGDRGGRPDQREDPGDGLERQLHHAQLQPRGPGTPPAGVGLQDLRAHRRDPQGDRPELDLLHVEAARHRRPQVRALGGQDLRELVHRDRQPHARDALLGQHRLRAADPRHRAEGGLRDGEAARASPRSSTATRPRGSAA